MAKNNSPSRLRSLNLLGSDRPVTEDFIKSQDESRRKMTITISLEADDALDMNKLNQRLSDAFYDADKPIKGLRSMGFSIHHHSLDHVTNKWS